MLVERDFLLVTQFYSLGNGNEVMFLLGSVFCTDFHNVLCLLYLQKPCHIVCVIIIVFLHPSYRKHRQFGNFITLMMFKICEQR